MSDLMTLSIASIDLRNSNSDLSATLMHICSVTLSSLKYDTISEIKTSN